MKTPTPRSSRTPGSSNDYTLRVIGGQWRGTRLIFPKIDAIRPTPDRVRETLFNWLQQDIVGARVLDLFAGSGAVGLEALSRGAAHAIFVETQLPIIRYLNDTLTRLKASNAQVHHGDALRFLSSTSESFDMVFMDPPFAMTQDGSLFDQLFTLLGAPGRLAPNAMVYLECPVALGPPDQWPCWPSYLQLHRSKQAGQVGYHLSRVDSTLVNAE